MPLRKQPLAPAIDAYLQGRNSPMAGHGMAFLRAGRKYGVDPRLLVGIATIESGAGAHLAQPYNPFNWGIHRGQNYGSWEESIMDVARGLRRGYIDKGLTTPGQIVSKYAPSSDGNNEANWANVVGQTMKQLGGIVPAGAVPTTRAAAPTAPPLSPQLPQAPTPQAQFDPSLFSKNLRNQFISGGGRINLGDLAATRQASYVAPATQLPTEVVQQKGIVDPGGDLQHPEGGNDVTKIAGTQIGKPYVFGSGPSTASFDCSDLIQWSYKQLGINLSRTTFTQIKEGRAVNWKKEQLQPGDLVFPSSHHVVMYVGNGKVIAAPHTGTVVQYQPLSQFGELYAVRRVLG